MFGPRLVSGIILIIIAFVTMFMGGPLLAGVLLIISLIAYRELTKALKVNTEDKGLNSLEIAGMAGVIVYYAYVYFKGTDIWGLMCIVGVFMAEMFLYVIQFPRYKAEQVTSAVFSFLYAPVMLSFIYQTRETQYGIYMVWLILISSWGCDTCAYVVGMLFGKKKIFPRLSPKKSLEGCIGGVAGSALLGGLYAYICVDRAIVDQNVLWVVVFICAAGAVVSMLGDLGASAIKRNNNIKDYGKLIPGHGGIMDRFDSVIVTAPMIYFLTILMIAI